MIDFVNHLETFSNENKITLSPDQENALKRIEEFLISKEDVFTLSGFAGSGKTHLMKYLVDRLNMPHVLVAPTHKAKLVLSRFVGCECFTLHQLLSLSPKIDIELLDMRFLEFIYSNKDECGIPYRGLVIVDEASMVNDDLYDLLVQECKKEKCKILFVGDIAQLRPVKNGKTSKVFDNPNQIIYLTEIHRQKKDNPLAQIIYRARNEIIPKEDFITSQDPLGSLFAYDHGGEFLKNSFDHISEMLKMEDVFKTKILAYTNDRVQGFNEAIRKYVIKSNEEYSIGEVLTCYDSYKGGIYEYINSEDYFIKSVELKERTFPNTVLRADCWELELQDSEGKDAGIVSILAKHNPPIFFDKLSAQIDALRIAATRARKGTRDYSLKWARFYQLFNSFFTPFPLIYDGRLIKKKSFDYGYALTIHKSQGSSFENVFIDMKDCRICREPEELRQLQYVGLSRTKSDIYVLR